MELKSLAVDPGAPGTPWPSETSVPIGTRCSVVHQSDTDPEFIGTVVANTSAHIVMVPYPVIRKNQFLVIPHSAIHAVDSRGIEVLDSAPLDLQDHLDTLNIKKEPLIMLFEHYLNPNGERTFPDGNYTKTRVVRDIVRAAMGYPQVRGAVIQQSPDDPDLKVVLMGDLQLIAALPNIVIVDPSNGSEPIVAFGDYTVDRVELTPSMNPVLHLVNTLDGLPSPQIVMSKDYERFLDRYLGVNVLVQSKVTCKIAGDYEHREEKAGRLVKVGQHRYAITFPDGLGISRSWAASEIYVNMMPEQPKELLQFTVTTGIEIGAVEKFHIHLRRLLSTYHGAVTVAARREDGTVAEYTGVPEMSANSGTLFLLNTEEGDVRRFVADIGTDPKLVSGATLPKVTGVILDR